MNIRKLKSKVAVPLLASVALLLSSGATEASAPKPNPNANNHVVFYVPHQDDEALSFGVGIMNHLKAGYQVHVVLLTDGSASFLRKRMGMTEKDFTNARNREFALSLKSMGVKSSNVQYMGFKDSQLTVAQVEKVIKSYEKKYPKARHKTFSWTDPHHDHSNAGIALKNVQKAKVTNDARYYVKKGYYLKGLRTIIEPYSKEFTPALKKASDAYSIENKSIGMYGIGRKSVSKSFADFDYRPLSRYHK